MKKVSTSRIARTLGLATLALSGALSFSAVQAQSTYPNKPIKFVVPYSAGTTTDVIARVYADKLGNVLGQNIIVDNKACAG
jgi:tripartite-type tricarboxylate transporter receptor subunit TctC